MLITYQDGQLDIVDKQGNIHNISDLFVKQMNNSKQVNDIYMYQQYAYLSMSFGILVIDMKKMEIHDTYYIGQNSSEVSVAAIIIHNKHLYAATQTGLFVANLTENLSDYNNWTIETLPTTANIQGM
jgi:hypothetical protein